MAKELSAVDLKEDEGSGAAESASLPASLSSLVDREEDGRTMEEDDDPDDPRDTGVDCAVDADAVAAAFPPPPPPPVNPASSSPGKAPVRDRSVSAA